MNKDELRAIREQLKALTAAVEGALEEDEVPTEPTPPPKRKRGRPKKVAPPSENEESEQVTSEGLPTAAEVLPAQVRSNVAPSKNPNFQRPQGQKRYTKRESIEGRTMVNNFVDDRSIAKNESVKAKPQLGTTPSPRGNRPPVVDIEIQCSCCRRTFLIPSTTPMCPGQDFRCDGCCAQPIPPMAMLMTNLYR